MREELRRLQGEELHTLAQNKRFEILDVNLNNVIIKVFTHGQERVIPMRDIEEAWRILTTTGTITANQILNDIGNWSSAFIAAMFTHLPGVTYETGPIRLYYRSHM